MGAGVYRDSVWRSNKIRDFLRQDDKGAQEEQEELRRHSQSAQGVGCRSDRRRTCTHDAKGMQDRRIPDCTWQHWASDGTLER